MEETNILVVDDEKEIADLLEIYLISDGFQVLKAYSAKEGLRILEEKKIDLVLLDVMMPQKTGFEVCQEVRANPAIQDTRILMLTAKGRDTDVAKGLALGVNAYMTKPFSTRELVDKVREMLGG